MGNKTLRKDEKENLKQGIIVKYQNSGQTLNVIRSRKQYEMLCTQIKAKDKSNNGKASITEDQIMSLFMDAEKLTFKSDFVDACYYYAYHKTTEQYREDNQAQFLEWAESEQQNVSTTSHDVVETIAKPQSIGLSTKWWWATGGLLLGFTIFFLNPFKKTEPVTWYMTTIWDGNTSFISEALRELTKEVYKNTNGEFRIMISNSLQLPDSGRTVSLEEVSKLVGSDAPNPRVHMLHCSKYYYQDSIYPSLLFFSAIPFGMTYDETEKWIGNNFEEGEEWAVGYKFWQSIKEKTGVITFPCGHSDAQWGGWYKKPILKVEDYKDQKVRIGGFAGRVLRHLGAKTCSVFQYELLQAMQTDSLFAAEWINAIDDYKMGLYKARSYKFVNNETWNEPNSMFEMTINRKAFKALPQHFQKALVAAIKKMNTNMTSQFANRGLSEKYEKLIKEEGVQFFELPKAVRDTLEKTTRKLLYEHVQRYKKNNPEIDIIYKNYLSIRPNLIYTPPQ
jgi:TRAP-type mannitol/chloroaromatic compound transport system substrate-binding protein